MTMTAFEDARVKSDLDSSELTDLSVQFVSHLKNGESVDHIMKKLALTSADQIENQLDSDAKKISFWLNVYNGFILKILTDEPQLYDNRRDFFKTKFISIGGQVLAFSDIEHGILRRSQHELFLGYLRRLFPPKYQRKWKPSKLDYRIHFALNCGAKSCPPVYIYNHESLDEDLNRMEATYIKKVSSYDESTNTVTTTPLTSWFRGDFKGKRGTKKLLHKHGIVPRTKVKLKYGDYDWTLDIDNFIED